MKAKKRGGGKKRGVRTGEGKEGRLNRPGKKLMENSVSNRNQLGTLRVQEASTGPGGLSILPPQDSPGQLSSELFECTSRSCSGDSRAAQMGVEVRGVENAGVGDAGVERACSRTQGRVPARGGARGGLAGRQGRRRPAGHRAHRTAAAPAVCVAMGAARVPPAAFQPRELTRDLETTRVPATAEDSALLSGRGPREVSSAPLRTPHARFSRSSLWMPCVHKTRDTRNLQ